MGIDIIAEAIILIPALLIWNAIHLRNIKKTMVYGVFAFYLVAVFSLTGLPSILDLRIDFYFNFVPFLDMISDIKNCLLNVLLFVPLGIFIPCLWNKYRKIKQTALLGLCVSMTIELLQIFTFRTSDVNDLIANMMGTIIGYFIATTLIKKMPKVENLQNRENELYLLFGIVLITMMSIQPLISSAIWNMVL